MISSHIATNTNWNLPKCRNILICFFFNKFIIVCHYLKTPLLNIPPYMSSQLNIFGITVTLFAWTAHKLACSSRPIRNASPPSWKAFTAMPWKHRSGLLSWTISLTSNWNGNLQMSNSVLLWYFLISFNAHIPLLIFCTSAFLLFSFSLSPLISVALLALSFLIFSHSAGVKVFFILHAISSNMDRFYFSTSIPILRQLVTNWSTQWNKHWTQKPTHVNQTKQYNSFWILIAKPDAWLLLEVWGSFILALLPLLPSSFPCPLILINLIPFPLLICFPLAWASYSALIFSLNFSELIIRCFNLSCMTCNHVRGFSAKTIPNTRSDKFLLLYPLITMIHKLSQSSYHLPPTMYPQIIILLLSLMERYRVSFYLSHYSGYYPVI